MQTQIFVNLPVKNLQKSTDFYTKLGYSVNPNFSDQKASCLVLSDTIYVMLLVEEFFKSFTKKEIVDTRNACQVINAISVPSREEVDQYLDKAVAAGALVTQPPYDYDFMYSRAFEDLDGHHWEVLWMDPAHV